MKNIANKTNKKTIVRVVALVLVILLTLGMFSSLLVMFAGAAASSGTTQETTKVITADTKVSQTLTTGKVVSGITITFHFLPDAGIPTGTYTFEEISMPAGSSFGWTTKTKLRVESVITGGVLEYYRATLSGVTYTGGSSKYLELFINDVNYISVPIPTKFFREPTTADEDIPKSDIVVQSVTVRDASGGKLAQVDKNTPPFTVEVTYYDVGLADEPKASIEQANINAFITGAPGFKTLGGTGGTVEILTSATQYPRFRVTFKNIQNDGSGTSIEFRVQYAFPDYEKGVDGKASAQLFQVEKPEDNANSLLKPNVIISEYTYGGEAIVAGNEFNLDLQLKNTSKVTDVENVVMAVEPGNGFIIAAASNTVYFENLKAGENQPYSIALRAAAAGNNSVGNVAGSQTDYSVSVKFSYQYLNKTEYIAGETSVKIAIPVTQLDRFSVDEITDYEQYMMVGQEGYISVPISNKGKSPTYNISGSIRANSGEAMFVAPVVHFGNLEAGKTGTVDMSVTINTPGEFTGEVVISYEDEYMNPKEITKPFSIMVDEPYIPPPEMPAVDPGAAAPQGLGLYTIILCAAGGLFVAVPIAGYIIKRQKARGSGDIDEDF